MSDKFDSARELAKERWKAFNSFDLSDDSWDQLFWEFGPPAVLQAIKYMSNAKDPNQEGRYKYFLRCLSDLVEHGRRSNRVQ